MHGTYLLPAQCSTLLEEVHRDFALTLCKDVMYHRLSPVNASVSARFYVLMVLLMKISVFFHVTPYRLVNRCSVIIQY